MVSTEHTLVCAWIIADGNYCWNAFAFTMMASPTSAGMLLVGVVPSWLRYRRTGRPSDWMLFQLAGYAGLVLAAEAVALHLIPQRGE